MSHTVNLDNISRSIAFLTDLHVGSPFAVFPDHQVMSNEGGNITKLMNKGQKELLRDWKKLLDTFKEFNVDTVCVLGDACQGSNPKEGGRYTMTPDLEAQKDAAEYLLEDAVKGRSLHMLCGTRYHESIDSKLHRELARRLEDYAEKSWWHGPIANVKLKGTNKILNMAHKSTNAMIYTTTIMDRERIFLKVAEAEKRLPHIDYQFRGHLHIYAHLDLPGIHLVQCPGFMVWFPFKDGVGLYGKTQPDIGGIILLIDKQNRTILLHFLYDAPHIIDMLKTE